MTTMHPFFKPFRWFEVHPRRLGTSPSLRVLQRSDMTTFVAIDGLVCGVCAARAEAALRTVPGVQRVEVNLGEGFAEIFHGTIAPDHAVLARALNTVVVAARTRQWLARIISMVRGQRL